MPAVSTYSAELPKDCEIWSPTIFTGASTPPQESTSIPHTPIAQVGVSMSLESIDDVFFLEYVLRLLQSKY